MSKIIAANFKSHLTIREIASYYKELNSVITPFDRVFVFPPFFGLQNPYANFCVGAQNAYPANNGAFTGEITFEALKDLKINSLLIGHSERRNILGETQEFCREKFDFYKEQGFNIFYCVGENLEIRQKGENAIYDFLQTQFEKIDTNYEHLMIAYEPIWAIGTGISATIQQIEQTHAFLKTLSQKPLLYGGSVKKNNLIEILKIKNVDGVLIGSASLDIQNFIEMIQLARKIKGY